jgi:hypothetical protein
VVTTIIPPPALAGDGWMKKINDRKQMTKVEKMNR